MKATDRGILFAVMALGLLVGFYFLIVAPKREEASKLGDDVTALQTSIDEQEQVAAFAEQARQEFPRYYGRVVVLGKAVPEQADSASMLVQLSSIAERSQVDFRGIELADSSGAAPAAAAPAPAAPAPEGGTPPADGTAPPADGAAPPADGATPAAATPTATDVPAAATEATAASLPIGASVGPAGLPTLPYDLQFTGPFFRVADFISGIDGLVHLQEGSGQVVANGRLLTIDGFALKGGLPGSSPELLARFALTSYVTPSAQGLTLGATPGGPAPSPVQPQTTPTSTVTP